MRSSLLSSQITSVSGLLFFTSSCKRLRSGDGSVRGPTTVGIDGGVDADVSGASSLEASGVEGVDSSAAMRGADRRRLRAKHRLIIGRFMALIINKLLTIGKKGLSLGALRYNSG